MDGKIGPAENETWVLTSSVVPSAYYTIKAPGKTAGGIIQQNILLTSSFQRNSYTHIQSAHCQNHWVTGKNWKISRNFHHCLSQAIIVQIPPVLSHQHRHCDRLVSSWHNLSPPYRLHGELFSSAWHWLPRAEGESRSLRRAACKLCYASRLGLAARLSE